MTELRQSGTEFVFLLCTSSLETHYRNSFTNRAIIPPFIIIANIQHAKIRTWPKQGTIPFWYFTNVGLDDVAKAFSILKEDALLLVRRDDGLTLLVPALSSKEARSMVEDNKLLWNDFCIAAPCMILAISWSEWPLERITMMTEFRTNINIDHQEILSIEVHYCSIKQSKGNYGTKPSTPQDMDTICCKSMKNYCTKQKTSSIGWNENKGIVLGVEKTS